MTTTGKTTSAPKATGKPLATVRAARPRKNAKAAGAPARPSTPLDPTKPLLSLVVFKKEYRCFRKGRKLTFRPGVNLLVGEQGCGKSSLLSLMHSLANGRPGAKYDRERALENISVSCESCAIYFFDFEKGNLRTQSYFDENIRAQVASMFSSHGETTRAQHTSLHRQLKEVDYPFLVLLDEPDMALSPRSAYQLAAALDEAGSRGHQILAAVHNPILIASQSQVFSLA